MIPCLPENQEREVSFGKDDGNISMDDRMVGERKKDESRWTVL